MKNYLLPIYHSKLKPWIKWWLLKQLELRSKTLSDWIEGTTPITITGAFKEKIQNLELEGNTSQTGTPTPEAPIPVRVVKGHNVVKINTTEYPLDLKSKNLFDKDNTSIGRLDTAGGIYYDTDYYTSSFIKVSPNTTYTKNSPTANAYHRVCFYTTNNASGFISASNNNTNTTPSNCQYLRYCGLVTEKDTSQINEGETALPYEAYYEYELCKLGDDYSDYILKDTNGYKIMKNVGKVVLNGSENWGLFFSTNGVFISSTTITSINSAATINCISNYYANTYTRTYIRNNLATVDNACATNNTELILANKSITSATDFQTWLSTHNTTVYYILPSSTTETITNTNLISQLDAIYNAEFKSGTNTITQTNSDLPFILHFKYYKKG